MTGQHFEDITRAMVQQAEASSAEPEGISVMVLTNDIELAREVAPMLAERLHPDIVTGEVLYAGPEHFEGPAVEVVLRVHGHRPGSAR